MNKYQVYFNGEYIFVFAEDCEADENSLDFIVARQHVAQFKKWDAWILMDVVKEELPQDPINYKIALGKHDLPTSLNSTQFPQG